MYTYFIGVGSNLGDRYRYIDEAFQSFQTHDDIYNVHTSTLIETEPWGYKDQGTFVNSMWSCESSLSPHDMLEVLQNLERVAGRERHIHWGPRTLDLDIILIYENDRLFSVDDEILTVPHPYFWERDFVLKSLMELLPAFIYNGISIKDRLSVLDI